MTAVRKGWSPEAQQDSVSLADIRARYVGSRLPAQVAADMEALWLELDRTRFALAGMEGRMQQVQVENEKLESRMYLLLAKVPGAGMAV
jgi:hypothetical protein